MSGAIIEIAGALVHETPGAILFADSGEEMRAVWLPRRLLKVVHPTGQTTTITRRTGQKSRVPVVNITLSERLAHQKGLI